MMADQEAIVHTCLLVLSEIPETEMIRVTIHYYHRKTQNFQGIATNVQT